MRKDRAIIWGLIAVCCEVFRMTSAEEGIKIMDVHAGGLPFGLNPSPFTPDRPYVGGLNAPVVHRRPSCVRKLRGGGRIKNLEGRGGKGDGNSTGKR
eukprot:1340552-Amorphochlora_amoeboformis.AAC.1